MSRSEIIDVKHVPMASDDFDNNSYPVTASVLAVDTAERTYRFHGIGDDSAYAEDDAANRAFAHLGDDADIYCDTATMAPWPTETI